MGSLGRRDADQRILGLEQALQKFDLNIKLLLKKCAWEGCVMRGVTSIVKMECEMVGVKV
jgi:hypothetical protein